MIKELGYGDVKIRYKTIEYRMARKKETKGKMVKEDYI